MRPKRLTHGSIERRLFVQGTGLAAVGLWAGCSNVASRRAGGSASSSPHGDANSGDSLPGGDAPFAGDAPTGDDDRGDGGFADADTPTCGEVTAANIEGPFFTPNSPESRNLREPGAPGVLLQLSGRVLDTSCQPLAGALLDFWHADDAGTYDNIGYTHRGHQFCDADGSYALATIIPGHYLNGATYRPAHVHVKAAGQNTDVLTTQLYFRGDPYNEGDPFIVDSLIMDLVADGGVIMAGFDFVLAQR